LKKSDPLAVEISDSTIRRFSQGSAAPTLATVHLLVKLMGAHGIIAPSSPNALYHSYPHALLQIVQGLDAIGLDWYMETFRRLPQLVRRAQRRRTQRRLSLAGNKIIGSFPLRKMYFTKIIDIQPGAKETKQLHRWVRRVVSHRDLFAVSLAYAYFGSYDYNDESRALLSLFDYYHADLERVYAEAIVRYPTFDQRLSAYAGPELRAAEDLLGNQRIDFRTRMRAISPLLQPWAFQFAEHFILGVPLLSWVEEDTIRENLK